MKANRKQEISKSTNQGSSLKMRDVPLSAVRELQLEIDRLEAQAKMELKDSQTRSLGSLRMDLVEECRRRLTFITYMIKDAQEHPDGD
jgi:hypothetical protein